MFCSIFDSNSLIICLFWSPMKTINFFICSWLIDMKSVSISYNVFCQKSNVFLPSIFYLPSLANSQLTTNIHWTCYCTVHVYVVIHFCVDMWSFWIEANLCRLYSICLYMYCLWRSSYQEGVVVIPLTGLALPCLCACPKLIPVEYILPSLFKVFSCTKTTKNQEIF